VELKEVIVFHLLELLQVEVMVVVKVLLEELADPVAVDQMVNQEPQEILLLYLFL
tara:strand:- start:2055 stop:2219 length:165 start_codon:yes stop_codon:yes gene_type:complete